MLTFNTPSVCKSDNKQLTEPNCSFNRTLQRNAAGVNQRNSSVQQICKTTKQTTQIHEINCWVHLELKKKGSLLLFNGSSVVRRHYQ